VKTSDADLSRYISVRPTGTVLGIVLTAEEPIGAVEIEKRAIEYGGRGFEMGREWYEDACDYLVDDGLIERGISNGEYRYRAVPQGGDVRTDATNAIVGMFWAVLAGVLEGP
jgi:hypothetical protein